MKTKIAILATSLLLSVSAFAGGEAEMSAGTKIIQLNETSGKNIAINDKTSGSGKASGYGVKAQAKVNGNGAEAGTNKVSNKGKMKDTTILQDNKTKSGGVNIAYGEGTRAGVNEVTNGD